MTTIFVLVDDWYQQTILPLLLPKAGAKARPLRFRTVDSRFNHGLLTLSRTDPETGFYASQLSP
ncbi:MAG: hypothetical protein F6K50_39695 [Moorea sp. SIO3I7]|nr:hypothetical protein [Moorena sp. SIO3I7]